MASTSHLQQITAFLLITLHMTSSVPTKNSARPVIEIINEQSRIDDKMRPPAVLPYGNPLAGNSKQNARLHAQNQQAMFNAERVRQHRAQQQRWTKAPQQEDSYMKAYHESQENHQLALEQQHLKDIKRVVVTKAPRIRANNPRNEKRGAKDDIRHEKRKPLDVIKITSDDAIIKENNRNHRSHGSVDFRPYLQSKKFQTVVSVTPAPTYDQGVTIKPNGNIGLANLLKGTASPEDFKLYTAAIPSEPHYIYPKQYGQMQSYQSAYEIDTLNSLLKKPASEQLTELNALINSEHHYPKEQQKDSLTAPIDLYFYLKDSNNVPKYYEDSTYGQIAPTYASAYTNSFRDHTPITEDIDDIEDPNKNNRLKHYGIQPVLATQAEETLETTTIKSNNYYKVEVASQTISAPYKTNGIHHYLNEETRPSFETLQYAKPTYYGLNGDLSEHYLHHNAHIGIQHINEDGIGVSAFADDNVSISNIKSNKNSTDIKIRKVRSTENISTQLDKDPFEVPSIKPLTESPTFLNESVAEPLVRVNYFNNKRNRNKAVSTFLTTPNFPIGVASEYENNYEDINSFSRFSNNEKYAFYDEYDDFDDDKDDYEVDYEENPINHRFNQNRFQNYAPTSSYDQQDSQPSFTKKFNQYQRPSFPKHNFGVYPTYSPQNSYGVPIQATYGPPEQSYNNPLPIYGPPGGPRGTPLKYNPISNPDVIEPVYMLTQSQLKHLIGDSNVNIQHYDIYQLPKRRRKRVRKYKERYPRQRNIKKNLRKLKKLKFLKK